MEITIVFVLLPLGGMVVGVIGTLMFGRGYKKRIRNLETGTAKAEGQMEVLMRVADVAKKTAEDESDYLLGKYGPDAEVAVHYFPSGELVCGTPTGDLVIKLEEKVFNAQKAKAERILRVLHSQHFLAPLKNKDPRISKLYYAALSMTVTDNKNVNNGKKND